MVVYIEKFQSVSNLIRHLTKIQHLHIKTSSQVYTNGCQLAHLLSQMFNIIKLDLDIQLNSCKQELQTKFWYERKWFVHCFKTSFESF